MKENHEFSVKRQKGVYDTPYSTALHMVKLIFPYITNNSRILDPAVGDGVFIKALLDCGVNTSNITAHDINEEVVGNVRQFGVNVFQKDSLLDEYEKKDIIIGNPPYKSRRNSVYMKENRKKLEKRYKDIGLYNLYSLFMFNSIKHLHDNGILCFIVEDAFLTNRYYRRFRKFLLDNCNIIELKLAPWRLFHSSKADVRTVIVTLQKKKTLSYFSNENEGEKNHKIRLVDRLRSEGEYEKPPKVQVVPQIEYRLMPDYKFFIGIPKSIIRLVQKPKFRFGDIAKGGTGISTGNDKKYLKPAQEVKNDPNWVGFYKSGQRSPYFYETPYFIEKSYQKNADADPKNFLIRNEPYFFREGITCSSVGRRFSAAYLPSGNLFGVNANFFFDSKDDLYYSLGFLNSKLVIYLARKVMNRSNIVATSFLKELPYVPPDPENKTKIIELTKKLVNYFMENPNYDHTSEQEIIDELIFDVFKISRKTRNEITHFCENIYEMA